ncbi:hypothetical protein Patl1_00555 [Pistacia atlantica]|uniref:Uncharacterized protein n=1 Tax=Pistacia atlantica TaxID=434234 RepID=A0ACC1CCL9_9ROSI|nr:hypothetical protein Patl1_00555 [Pistacia atlantica]
MNQAISSRTKYSEHRTITTKLVKPSRFQTKVVRILVTDVDATDSSSDEDEDYSSPARVKKHINEIKIEDCSIFTGKESQTIYSPTSVLRFQSNENEEAEQRTEYQPETETDSEWRKVQDCLFLDEGFLDSETPPRIFFDEMSVPILAENLDDISVSLDGDFGSCIWDVDNYFQEHSLPLH